MNDIKRLVLNIASKNKIKHINIEYRNKYEYDYDHNWVRYTGSNIWFNFRKLNNRIYTGTYIYNINTLFFSEIRLSKNY